VSGLQGGQGIDVDDTSVYWAEGTAQSVSKVDKNATNGVAIPLFTGTNFSPLQVRDDGDYVSVVNVHGGVARINKTAGKPMIWTGTCTADGTQAVAVDASFVYFGYARDTGAVLRADKGGTSCDKLLAAVGSPVQVEVDDTSIFFSNDSASPSTPGLAKAPKGGGAITPIQQDAIPTAGPIAMDARTLFVATTDRLVRLEKDGTGLVELATGQPAIQSVALDATNVYWSNASGGMWTADKVAGKPRQLADGQLTVNQIAVDNNRIYWVTNEAVVRIAK
jgi:hypothetical protein